MDATDITMKFGSDFNNLPNTAGLQAIELTNSVSGDQHTIINEPGKHASVKIFYAISNANELQITAAQAKIGLKLYGDYVEQEQQQPHSHSNIRLLLDIIAYNQVWSVKVI